MAMSRKDYVADATALARIYWEEGTHQPTMAAAIAALAAIRSADNPRFDRARFIAACTKQPL